jgi:predicted nucleic acid-binding Zn ribbon protein
MREQDPKSKFSLGSEVLQRLFESGNSPLSEQFMRWKLWARWEDFVGSTVAKNTEPVGLYRGTLYLCVRNSSWMQQLTFMKDHIRNTINEKLGRQFVKNIRFTLDRREVPQDNQEDFKSVIQRMVPESGDKD